MSLFTIIKRIKYILLSRHKNGHGLDSPFVFDLVSRVFRNKTDMFIVFTVESQRRSLLSDKRKIMVEDHGRGSDRMKNNLRKVSDIARYSSVPRKYGMLLANLSGEFGSPSIIELGTSIGISTMYMALANPESEVYTIEGSCEISRIARSSFDNIRLQNVRSITGTFENMFPEVLLEVNEPSLVFIDGNHRKQPLLNYFQQIAEVSVENTVVIIDDIYNSREMTEAWTTIKKHEKVSLTVDIFRMGMVFFRKGMTRQDFIIRY
jgi:predicted O-methyltransferase YrrM